MNVAAPRALGTANPTILPTNGGAFAISANHVVGQHQDSSHPDFKSPTAVAVDDANAEITLESLRLAFSRDLTPGFTFKGSIARLTALLHGPPVGIDSDPHQCSHLCHNGRQRCFDPNYTCWEEMKRVGFADGEAGSWADKSAYIDALARGSPTQDGMDADGNPSVESKNAIKHRVVNARNEGISDLRDEAVLVGACLVAVVKRVT